MFIVNALGQLSVCIYIHRNALKLHLETWCTHFSSCILTFLWFGVCFLFLLLDFHFIYYLNVNIYCSDLYISCLAAGTFITVCFKSSSKRYKVCETDCLHIDVRVISQHSCLLIVNVCCKHTDFVLLYLWFSPVILTRLSPV